MADYDVVIIGAGHNGLTAAAYLAKAGLKALVVEKNSFVGGCASTQELFEGCKFNLGAHFLHLFQKKIRLDLELEKSGLRLDKLDPWCFYPFPNGKYFMWYHDIEKTIEEMRKQFTAKDAEGFREYVEFWRRFWRIGRDALLNPPVSLGKIMDAFPGAEGQDAARKAFLYGFVEFINEFPIESTEIKAAIGYWANTVGFFDSLTTPGSNFMAGVILYSDEEPFWYVKGGMGQISEALSRFLQSRGGEVKLSSPVKQILIEQGKAIGVKLENGESISAKMVLSNVDPHNLFLRLVGIENLPTNSVRLIKSVQFYMPFIQIFCVLNELPDYRVYPGKEMGPQHSLCIISPSLEYIEKAWVDCKFGGASEKPTLAMSIPSVLDPSLVPAGKHLASIYVLFAPYELTKGEQNKAKEEFADRTIDLINEYAPNFKASILHRKVFAPYDYEKLFGVTKGDGNHGVLKMHSLFTNRPFPGWSQYRTPVQNLYLCGSGGHPGAGVTGAPGHNCAQVVLADLEKGGSKSKTKSSKKTR